MHWYSVAVPGRFQAYKLYIDATYYVIGGILMQENDNVEKPIQYISKQLSDRRKKYSAIEREAYTVIYAF